MRRPHILAVIATASLQFGPSAAWSQSRDSAREATYERYWEFRSLIKGAMVQPEWIADGTGFWYATGAPDNTVIYRVDLQADTKVPLFDVARVRAALTPLLGHEPAYRGLPFDEFTFEEGGKAAKFTVEGRPFVLNLATYQVDALPAPTAAERDRTMPRRVSPEGGGLPVMEVPSPDGRWFVTHKDHNLWLRSGRDGRLLQLTRDGVARDEWIVGGWWGIRPSTAKWSPDGLRLAAMKIDTRRVRVQPLVHWLNPEEEVQWEVNPIAGGAIQQMELYVVDITSKEAVRVDIGHEPDQYLNLIGWRPDGSELLFFRVSRDFRRVDLMVAEPTTGRSRVMLTETSKTFVEGYTDWPSRVFTPLWERGQLLWLSERDGWRHMYLYGLDGELVRRLTAGEFPVHEVVAVDKESGVVYFTARSDPQRPYDTHLHRVGLDGKGGARLTDAPGQHAIQFTPSRSHYLDTHSDIDRPPVVELRRADGQRVRILEVADTSGLDALRRQPIERFVVKAADDTTDLYGVLFKPFDFDPQKRYPVIEVFYPGDQTTAVPRLFSLNNFWGIRAQAWAQLGYITFVVDARGTPGRGKAFQDVVYLGHGRNEIPDHAAVVKQLVRERPYMDSTRVGVWGHSWGGYFAIRALLLAPEVYQVGVASAPLADLEATYWPTEPYMLTPQENSSGYAYASNMRFADRLKGKLLMIVGSNDGAHLMGHVFRQADAFIRAGKLFDVMVLPEQGHGYTGAGAQFAERYVRRYFETHLRPDRGAAVSTDAQK